MKKSKIILFIILAAIFNIRANGQLLPGGIDKPQAVERENRQGAMLMNADFAISKINGYATRALEFKIGYNAMEELGIGFNINYLLNHGVITSKNGKFLQSTYAGFFVDYTPKLFYGLYAFAESSINVGRLETGIATNVAPGVSGEGDWMVCGEAAFGLGYKVTTDTFITLKVGERLGGGVDLLDINNSTFSGLYYSIGVRVEL